MSRLALALAAVLSSFQTVQSCTLEDISGIEIIGICNYESISAKVTGTDGVCSKASFDDLFGGETSAMAKMSELCSSADKKSRENFVPWSDITKRGTQFDKEFFDGNTAFNQEYATADNKSMLQDDVERLKGINDDVLENHGIQWPNYIYNFDETSSCTSRAAMCCWTGDRDEVGAGSCKGTDCIDEEPEPSNTDVCFVNMTMSPLASHVKRGEAFFPGTTEGVVNCHGFAWEESTFDLDNKYKGNLLFKVGMMEGLVGNGYVGSVPGAPMCGCIEQMPIVSRAKCSEIEVQETWELGIDQYYGTAMIELKYANIELLTCTNDEGEEIDLATYSKNKLGSSIDDYVAADCDAVEAEWLRSYDLGYRKKTS